MEVILSVYAAICFALLIVHLVDYVGGRSSLSFDSRTEPRASEVPSDEKTPSPERADQFDRAA